MNKKINIALIALMAFSAGTVSAETNSDAVVCTADAKVCPDGTSVGRTGPNCEFVCGVTTAGTITSNIPAFTAEDKMRGWYYGDKNQRKSGTPAGWLIRNAGTRSAQWYNPGLTSTKPIDTTNLPQKPSIGVPPIPRPEIRKEKEGVNNREEMEARAKMLRASTTAANLKIKDVAQKKRIEVARKQTNIVNKRLEAAIDRVQKLSDRVAERLTKLETEGVNTMVSRGHLAEAKTKLDEARIKAATLKLTIETAFANVIVNVSSTTTPGTAPKNAMKDVQEAVKEVAKVIQEAHKHVALSISTVKPGQNKPRPATTTQTTAPATTSATTTQ
ncbi:MAG: hypothetical protein WBC83_01305 [Minisyncoccia bacterium]